MRKTVLGLTVALLPLCARALPTNGLTMWLKADAIEAGDLQAGGAATWRDQSGSGLDVGQGTPASQPTYVTNALNGQPVVRFDGSGDYLIRQNVLGSSFASPNTTTAYVVQKQAGADIRSTTLSWVWGSGSPPASNRYMLHATWEDVVAFQYGDSVSDTQPTGWDDTWHVIELFRDGLSGEVKLDGVPFAQNSGMTTSLATGQTADFYIGHDRFNTNLFTGDIAEIVIYNRALSPGERLTVASELGTKYSLTVPEPSAALLLILALALCPRRCRRCP